MDRPRRSRTYASEFKRGLGRAVCITAKSSPKCHERATLFQVGSQGRLNRENDANALHNFHCIWTGFSWWNCLVSEPGPSGSPLLCLLGLVPLDRMQSICQTLSSKRVEKTTCKSLHEWRYQWRFLEANQSFEVEWAIVYQEQWEFLTSSACEVVGCSFAPSRRYSSSNEAYLGTGMKEDGETVMICNSCETRKWLLKKQKYCPSFGAAYLYLTEGKYLRDPQQRSELQEDVEGDATLD